MSLCGTPRRNASIGTGGAGIIAGQNRIDHRAAGDAGRQRSDRVQGRRQRHHAGDRYPSCRRLVADHAAERRRNAHEPPVSVPSATTAIPSATATAAPEEVPPGMRRARSQGASGVP